MIIGTGIDLIENIRIEALLKSSISSRFFKKIFTENEVLLAGGRALFFAGNFAAKEAFAKSLGTGFRGFMPNEVEILRDELGKPYINLYGGALKRLNEMFSHKDDCKVHVSITNTKDYSCASVFIEDMGK